MKENITRPQTQFVPTEDFNYPELLFLCLITYLEINRGKLINNIMMRVINCYARSEQ